MLVIENRNKADLARDQMYCFTVNNTDTTSTVLPVPVSYHLVLTVCNPIKLSEYIVVSLDKINGCPKVLQLLILGTHFLHPG